MLELIEEVDLSDPSQAQAARDAVGEMLKPDDNSLSPIPTRPSKKKKKQEQDSDSNEDDVNEQNSDYGEEGKQTHTDLFSELNLYHFLVLQDYLLCLSLRRGLEGLRVPAQLFQTFRT